MRPLARLPNKNPAHSSVEWSVEPDLRAILTMAEASKELRCSKAHLSHIVNGKVPGLPPLPVARIGRRVIIRREVLLKWLGLIDGAGGIMAPDLNSSLETHERE